MVYEVLQQLRTPSTASGLALALAANREVVEAVLEQLEGRGYVARAFEGSTACPSGCGSCSVQRLCPSSGEAAPVVPVWRLTGLGLKAAIPGRV